MLTTVLALITILFTKTKLESYSLDTSKSFIRFFNSYFFVSF